MGTCVLPPLIAMLDVSAMDAAVRIFELTLAVPFVPKIHASLVFQPHVFHKT